MTEKHTRRCAAFYHSLGIIIALLIGMAGTGRAANVLYAAPSPAISHYQMLEPLMLSLAQRGHNVTVLSNFPQKKKLPNYTDIDLRGMFPKVTLEFKPSNLVRDTIDLFNYGSEMCKTFTSSDKIQQFVRNDNKFDLIFIEAFESDCLLGLVAKFKTPYIIFSAMSLPVWESDWIYNPVESVYYPDILCRLGGKMNFYQRIQNIACQIMFRGLYWLQTIKPALEITKNSFNLDIDNFDSLKRNVSFIFANSFHGLTGVRPLLPNVVEIGGIHLKHRKPLPENIEKFCNESNGVILFSMGSIVQAATLSQTIKSEFLSEFSKLKERVLWKWEEEIPNKPKNLMTLPWLPQSDVLGHPKVKLFISHGGIHGLYEAIYNGVPIIGIPLFGDQIGNLKALELKGVAVTIDFADLNGKTLSSAINKVLSNDSFRQNAELLSRIFRDQPQTPLDKAIFWTEYAIRHGGAPHFQSGVSQLSWFQYALIDPNLWQALKAVRQNGNITTTNNHISASGLGIAAQFHCLMLYPPHDLSFCGSGQKFFITPFPEKLIATHGRFVPRLKILR